MAELLFLDTGPLGLACKDKDHEKASKCRSWLKSASDQGRIVMIAEICDYEVRREFVRADKQEWIIRLNTLAAAHLVPLTRQAILKASDLWALLRNKNQKTADDSSLDGDVILVAQAITVARPGDKILIASQNDKHLSRFPEIEVLPLSFLS